MSFLHRAHEAGVTTALEKLALSGGMYARALQGAAQRGGGRIAPQILGGIATQPRAARAPFLSQQARTPGALAPSGPQQGMQHALEGVPWAGSEYGGGAPARATFDQMLSTTGRTHAAPGLQQQITDQFGIHPSQIQSASAGTVAGKKRGPVSPLAPTQLAPHF